MYYALKRQVIGGKYSRWIMILQEFELEFTKSTSKKSLIFAGLICDLAHTTNTIGPFDSFPNELFFLISMTDPCYEDIILYLQTLQYHPTTSQYEHRRICHQAKYYLILNDTLYCRGIDSILLHCLTH